MIPYFLCKARNENKRFFIQFGGQGNSFLKEMQILYEREDLKEFFDVVFQAIDYCIHRDDIKLEKNIFYPEGFPLKDWLEKRKQPKEEYLSICTITFPGNQITQLGNLYAFIKNGYDPDEFLSYVHSVTGHSGGLQAAVIFALGKKNKDLLDIIYNFIIWYTIAGYYVQKSYGFREIPEEILEWSLKSDKEKPYPMAVVSNIGFSELEDYIEEFHNKYIEIKEFPIKISLINGNDIFVITGHAKDIALFRKEYYDIFIKNNYKWNYIPVSAPFHRWDTMKEKIYDFYNDEACKNLTITGKDLKVPVISFTDDAINLQNIENISEYLADAMMNQVLYWEKAIYPLFQEDSKIDYVLDFGPGKITTILTKLALKGTPKEKLIEIHSCVGRAGLNYVIRKVDPETCSSSL
ncbi:MAG: ACP S-malonyltransferase [Leptospiraceae bacterium]|nr:MAG: ACP S-malonyltransferase [Leptospiraceae bacterium]